MSQVLSQANDFRAESDVLFKHLSQLSERDFDQKTQFKGWSLNDIIGHLHYWNQAVDLSLNDEAKFIEQTSEIQGALAKSKLRDVERLSVKTRGLELVSEWNEFYRTMVMRWIDLDPKLRIKWIGPDMSVRSAMTARQMETWAHGQAIFDISGKQRQEGDRIRNIVVLGFNTFSWTCKIRKVNAPAIMPRLSLTSPSGELWEFGEPTSINSIVGSAVEFCQVVTQTRNIADTKLDVQGNTARWWMAHAQCFAGPVSAPPVSGSRFMVEK